MVNYRLVIGGEQIETDSYAEVKNPANGEIVGLMPIADEGHLDRAVSAASVAFLSWSETPEAERKAACHAIADIVERHAEELAQLLTREQGKPLNGLGSRWEIGGTQAWTHYTADLELPMQVLQDNNEGRVELHRKPVGVVGSITPWNFPVLIASWHIVPAVRAGNTVLIKPSPFTPLSTIRFVELINEVLPAGVVNVVTGLDSLGAAMSSHPGIAKLSFTGSIGTGQKIMSSAAHTLKKLTLELGGNDAGIVLDDINPKEAAPKLFGAAFQNNGQVCIAMKRLYVHESIYDEMCDELVALAEQAVVGDGLDQGTKYGPIQNRSQYEKVKVILADARLHGTVIAGGDTMEGPGYFMRPTIVRDIAEGARLVDEEQFGPVLPIIKFADEDDAMTRANASSQGLGGSIWSSRPERAYQLALRMDAGTIWVNQHGKLDEDVPFGGAKQSGFGVEMGREGLNEFTQLTVISIAL